MATNFYERQDVARRNTAWLVLMFVVAVICIVGVTFVATAIAFGAATNGGEPIPLELPVGASVGALALIGGGSAFKIAQLAGGGTVVAERLGGRRIYPNTTDPAERRLLNVVEEMALASGVPVPPVFLLTEEQGLNAFAAGFSPSDAVIGVTRGCAEQLTRDELQGVIAHEFSHILNGDMRLNLRLIGVLHGILLMGLIGRELLRIAFYGGQRRSRNDKNNGLPLLAIGLIFLIVGFIGLFFGNLIKAAVSRQREFLADASAVQFTRNPEGIAGALKRIGAAVFGSKLVSPRAAEASHMFFAAGLSSLFATHPPLDERIRRLEPAWDGVYPPALPAGAVVGIERESAAGFVGEGPQLFPQRVPVDVVEHASEQVASPREIHQRYVQELVAAMPPAVVDAAHEPYGARALIYASLLDRDAGIRGNQLRMLEEATEPDVFDYTLHLTKPVAQLDVRARLPLVDMTLPALRALSLSQYRQFMHCFEELVRADDRTGLFEWTLHKVLLRHLRPQFEPAGPKPLTYYRLDQMSGPCSVLLSALAVASKHADSVVFEAGAQHLPDVNARLLPPEECRIDHLDDALEKLARVAPKERARLVDACAASICADADVNVAEGELLRAICDIIDCPMPPLVAGQKVSPSLFPSHAQSEA